jgi:Tat protein secretion system quality control protein TatD with DNase activity
VNYKKNGVDFCRFFICYLENRIATRFKNGQFIRDAVAKIPMDRLVVETDSPYLTPEPNRGKRNEPTYVKFTEPRTMAMTSPFPS